MTNDEYAARNIMQWPEKLGGWVTPEGFIDRAFWKPSEDRNQLAQVCREVRVWANENDCPDIKLTVRRAWADAEYDPGAALDIIMKAHKESEE